MTLLQFLAAIFSFGASHTKSSRRFLESPRKIDNGLQLSKFPVFWVISPLKNASEAVNTSWRFLESPRMIDN
jgi:hypothetical protein